VRSSILEALSRSAVLEACGHSEKALCIGYTPWGPGLVDVYHDTHSLGEIVNVGF
jgi:hypothetical protein